MKITGLLILLFSFSASFGQAVFIRSGSIEFERSINVRKQGEDSYYSKIYVEELKGLQAFYTSKFLLYFDSAHTLYKLQGELLPFKLPYLLGPAKDNIVLTDLKKQTSESSKQVFEEKYLVRDSTGKIKWKITGETREIAGFNCRKAVGRICDSVYVTAFYTDEIISTGGPESFNGLPGMILGIAIPRLHTTWFATKVEITTPKADLFNGPLKGKPIGQRELEKRLQNSSGFTGKDRANWWILL